MAEAAARCRGCPGSAPLKRQAELFFPPEFADDFPVAMQISERYGLVYVVTKLGLLVRGEGFARCPAQNPALQRASSRASRLVLRAADGRAMITSVKQMCPPFHSFHGSNVG